MNKVLFAGPSIHGLDLESAGDFVLRPPAKCGDILEAARSGFRVIGLVDGLFGSCRSVWHKEILFALSRGVRVLGAASMGALRAAECDRFGMEGIGRIYRDYRDGRRTDDADVALLHGPAELAFQPLTVALVDAEATIAELHARALISADAARALLQTARRLHFSQRTWERVVRDAGMTSAVLEAAAACKVERKKADAQDLIERMCEPFAAAPLPESGDWMLNQTLFLSVLEVSLS